MRREVRAACCSGSSSGRPSSTPRITPIGRLTRAARQTAPQWRRGALVWRCGDGAPGLALDCQRTARDGIPASRIEVLSNGVDAVDLPGVEHEDGRVLFVSRLEREKGALDAVAV